MAVTGPYDQFILFGDSITQQACDQKPGFALSPALQNAYIRRLDVINRGFSGYNTTQALHVLPKFMPTVDQANVRFMMVFLGANDSCLPNTTGQYVPLDVFKQNLEKIITFSGLQTQDVRIILVTVPPVDEYLLEIAHQERGLPYQSRTAENTKKYADASRETGIALGVAVLDLWSIIMLEAGWKDGQPLPGSKNLAKSEYLGSLLRDGLHFKPKAYEILYEALMEVIKRRWPDQCPDNIPFNFPPREVLDGDRP